MSKGQLEEARINIDWDKGKIPPDLLPHINYLFKQAERVQELEKRLKVYQKRSWFEDYEKVAKQNKRYRATINAMGQILKDAIHALDVGEKVQGLEYGVKIANDALESDSE